MREAEVPGPRGGAGRLGESFDKSSGATWLSSRLGTVQRVLTLRCAIGVHLDLEDIKCECIFVLAPISQLLRGDFTIVSELIQTAEEQEQVRSETEKGSLRRQ